MLARPVRMCLKSWASEASALSNLAVQSLISVSKLIGTPGRWDGETDRWQAGGQRPRGRSSPRTVADHRARWLRAERGGDRARGGHVEHPDGDAMVAADREGGRGPL